ncbi:MAG: DUF883 family protein [Pseudomonadota bacterium]
MSSTAESISQVKDRIVEDAGNAARQGAADIKRVVKDIEDLLGRISKLDDPRIDEVRAKLQSSLDAARSSTQHAAGRLRSEAAAAAKSTDEFVHDRPWAVAGIAAVVGLALGVALVRR